MPGPVADPATVLKHLLGEQHAEMILALEAMLDTRLERPQPVGGAVGLKTDLGAIKFPVPVPTSHCNGAKPRRWIIRPLHGLSARYSHRASSTPLLP